MVLCGVGCVYVQRVATYAQQLPYWGHAGLHWQSRPGYHWLLQGGEQSKHHRKAGGTCQHCITVSVEALLQYSVQQSVFTITDHGSRQNMSAIREDNRGRGRLGHYSLTYLQP